MFYWLSGVNLTHMPYYTKYNIIYNIYNIIYNIYNIIYNIIQNTTYYTKYNIARRYNINSIHIKTDNKHFGVELKSSKVSGMHLWRGQTYTISNVCRAVWISVILSPQGRDGETVYPPMVLDSFSQLRPIPRGSQMNQSVHGDKFLVICNTCTPTSYSIVTRQLR